ncbi:MAG: putative CoA-binding protein [Halioglobus sp.]|jgi:predicted CoA-binding protein
MPLEQDTQIAQLLIDTKTIALEIASPKPERASHRILQFLLEEGYDVYPVNPGLDGEKIAGRDVYGSLEDIPVPIDMIDIFRRSDAVEPIVARAIKARAKCIWMQLGVINTQASELAQSAGLDVVMDKCPAIEIPRLRELGLM